MQPAPRPQSGIPHPVEPQPITRSRGVEQVLQAQPASDGAGVRLKRNLGPSLHRRLDPFLMLDEFRSDDAQDYIAGFPDHPHRGFETITYMLAGAMRHRDSRGNEGHLRNGSVQWMKAARGIIHSEMPEQEEGLMHGFQLWLNLPAAEKMADFWYDDIAADRIPAFALPAGVTGKVIAGEVFGVRGPGPQRETRPLYVDLSLPAAARAELPIPGGHNAFAYVYEGSVRLGQDEREARVAAGNLVVLGNEPAADGIAVAAQDGPARLLVLAGSPLREPIVQYGPFVMNTKEEIGQAFEDYQAGKLGR
jgi:redox-sensitive bicupin YhaK (pirin superfamily)